MTTKLMTQKLMIAALSENPAEEAFKLVRKHKRLIGWKPLEDLLLKDTLIALQYLQICKREPWIQLFAALKAEHNIYGPIRYSEALRQDGKNVKEMDAAWARQFAGKPNVMRVKFRGAK